MAVETLGDAHSMGWRVIARCTHGREDGPRGHSNRACTYPQGVGHGDAGVDAGEGVSAVTSRNAATLPALRIA